MYLEDLQLALKNKYDTEFRDGIHVSDLTLCHRKSIFRRLQPAPLTMKELNYFTSGRAIHDALQTLAKRFQVVDVSNIQFGQINVIESRFDIEKEVVWNGVTGHIDMFDNQNNVAIEAKSSRIADSNKPYSFHEEQLKYYMVMTGAKKGVILYQFLLNKNGTPFKEFEVDMTDAQLKSKGQEIILKRDLYKRALDAKDPKIAENVFENPDMNWLCKDCPHFKQCCEWSIKK